MQGIENILNRIENDAVLEGKTLLEEARLQAAQIDEDYGRRADALFQALREKAEREAREYEEQLVSAAGLEARRRELTMRQTLLDETFEGARQELAALPDERKTALLARLAAEVSNGGGEQITLNAADTAVLGETVVAQANLLLAERNAPSALTLSSETHGGAGGLLLRGNDLTVNCTFEALIEQKREEMSIEIAYLLFAQQR